MLLALTRHWKKPTHWHYPGEKAIDVRPFPLFYDHSTTILFEQGCNIFFNSLNLFRIFLPQDTFPFLFITFLSVFYHKFPLITSYSHCTMSNIRIKITYIFFIILLKYMPRLTDYYIFFSLPPPPPHLWWKNILHIYEGLCWNFDRNEK